MIKALIIDDEEDARNVLKTLLVDYCPNIEVIGLAKDVPSAVIEINKLEPDVIFLDIEMPNYSGFELLDFFQEVNFEIVFITAYSEYAIRAFEVSAIDYLLKPLQIDKLEEAAKKIESRIGNKLQSQRIETLRANLSESGFQKIALPVSDGLAFVKTNDIISLEADGSYTHLYLKNGDRMLISKRLKFFEDILKENSNFYRVHRSSMANINYIASYNKSEGYLRMENGPDLRIARDKKADFEAHIAHMKV